MVGEWIIDVKLFLFPEFSENVSYHNSFKVTILPAKEQEKPEIELIEEIIRPNFTGMVVLFEQSRKERRGRPPPQPYIVSISPTGIVTIGWSVSMKTI